MWCVWGRWRQRGKHFRHVWWPRPHHSRFWRHLVLPSPPVTRQESGETHSGEMNFSPWLSYEETYWWYFMYRISVYINSSLSYPICSSYQSFSFLPKLLVEIFSSHNTCTKLEDIIGSFKNQLSPQKKYFRKLAALRIMYIPLLRWYWELILVVGWLNRYILMVLKLWMLIWHGEINVQFNYNAGAHPTSVPNPRMIVILKWQVMHRSFSSLTQWPSQVKTTAPHILSLTLSANTSTLRRRRWGYGEIFLLNTIVKVNL